LPAAPWRALAAGAGRGVDLITGHTRDEYRLFTLVSGQRGNITDEPASDALRGLAGAQGEAAYRQAYPGADADTLFELVNSDWLFRMPTLHLAQAHAAAGGGAVLFPARRPARGGGRSSSGSGPRGRVTPAPATASMYRWCSTCPPASGSCCSVPSRR